jgi:hypothetical protein
MNVKQKAATAKLLKALDACHEAGIKGGVFDSSFCIWPIDAPEDPYESGNNFFRIVEKYGADLTSKMSLDGGAGT